MKVSSSQCILPWISTAIGTQGQVLRCQMSREPMGHLSKNSLLEIHNNSKYVGLRDAMLRGEWDLKNVGCTACHLRESKSFSSKRRHWQKEGLVQDLWKDSTFTVNTDLPIYHLDLAFNNVCNFKCRMCNSAYSTRWVQDEKRLAQDGFKVQSRLVEGQDQAYNILNSLKEMLPRLKTLRRLEIVGGEPFLVPEFLSFIEILQSEKIAPNCELMVTTNGSVLRPEHLEAIAGFKYVNVNISIDGTGSLFEYIRSSGACTWNEICEKVKLVKIFADKQNEERPDCRWKLNLNGAFQIYNMLNISDFFSWIFEIFEYDQKSPVRAAKNRNSFEHRLLMSPSFLSCYHAPAALKRDSLEQLQILIGRFPWLIEISESRYIRDIMAMLQKPDSADREMQNSLFLDYTAKLDLYRHEQDISPLASLKKYFDH